MTIFDPVRVMVRTCLGQNRGSGPVPGWNFFLVLNNTLRVPFSLKNLVLQFVPIKFLFFLGYNALGIAFKAIQLRLISRKYNSGWCFQVNLKTVDQSVLCCIEDNIVSTGQSVWILHSHQ